MAGTDVMRTPLAAALWPATGRGALVRAATLALFGSLMLWASAKVQVPFWPVPMTMQTYVVLVIGAAYGARLGAATVALYLAQGFAGLPVFAGAATGPAYLMGPTAGYLVGFVAAAALVGALTQRGAGRSVVRMLFVMALGSVTILTLGVAWLSTVIGFDKAVAVGLLPFLTGDVLKTALAAATLPLAWRAVDRKG